MPDQTIIEQVARQWLTNINGRAVPYPPSNERKDTVRQVLEALATLQSSAVLPSEAITDDECPTCQGRGDVWTQSPGLPRNPQPEQCGDCYGTGRTNPTAPVQDDDAEWLLEQARRWDDDTVVHRIIRTRLERIASRLSPTPETGLVEALTKCRVFFQHATAQNTRAILAEIDTALSNVSRLDANAERL
jgi:hypothetical protein